ncbi:hypothetical protein FGF1_30020 [Flavobacteriaceae bacterium GF1]
MKKVPVMTHSFPILLLGVLVSLSLSCQMTTAQSEITLFEPENISTEAVEYAPSFSPSGSEIYFSKSNDQWGKGGMRSAIYYSIKTNQKWSKPKLAPFSGQYDDSAPHITNEGRTLYFISQRPSANGQHTSQDIWKVERDENDNWGTPMRLDSPINSWANEYCLRTDGYGNLYFASDRKGGYGQGDLYVVKKTTNGYSAPVNLGKSLNTEKGEWNLEVNKEGNMIIFEASERAQNRSSYGDLYISFKVNDTWSLPQNIQEINTTGSDLYPEFREGENRLYFSSSDSLRSVRTNIYFTEFRSLKDKYGKSAVFPK